MTPELRAAINGPRRLLVTGSRELRDRELVEFWLDRALSQLAVGPKRVTLVHGACRGADELARDWALSRGVTPESHPADWHLGGNGAGPARNTKMVRLGAHLCVAFWTGKASGGTFDCFTKAARVGIPVWVVPS